MDCQPRGCTTGKACWRCKPLQLPLVQVGDRVELLGILRWVVGLNGKIHLLFLKERLTCTSQVLWLWTIIVIINLGVIVYSIFTHAKLCFAFDVYFFFSFPFLWYQD